MCLKFGNNLPWNCTEALKCIMSVGTQAIILNVGIYSGGQENYGSN